MCFSNIGRGWGEGNFVLCKQIRRGARNRPSKNMNDECQEGFGKKLGEEGVQNHVAT